MDLPLRALPSPRCVSVSSPSSRPSAQSLSPPPRDSGRPGANFSANFAAGADARLGFLISQMCKTLRSGEPMEGLSASVSCPEPAWCGFVVVVRAAQAWAPRVVCVAFCLQAGVGWEQMKGESGSVNHCSIQANSLNKGEWVKLSQGEKFLEKNMPFSVYVSTKQKEVPSFPSSYPQFGSNSLIFLFLKTSCPPLTPMSSCLAKCNLHVTLYWIFRGS